MENTQRTCKQYERDIRRVVKSFGNSKGTCSIIETVSKDLPDNHECKQSKKLFQTRIDSLHQMVGTMLEAT